MTFEKKSSPEKWTTDTPKQADASDVQHTQSTIEYGSKLKQVHDVLDAFDFTDEKEVEYRAFLLWQDAQFLKAALRKPHSERLQFLFQAQIDALKVKGLSHLSKAERLKFAELNKQLVADEGKKQEQPKKALATEQVETDQNARAIAAENNRQQQKRLAQDQKIAALNHTLLGNPAIAGNGNIGAIKGLFTELDGVSRTNESWKRKILQDIIDQLKSPWTLESIAHDLGWTETKAYQEFKSQLLVIEPDLQASFEKAEINMAGSLAKIKLWTNTLDEVTIKDDKLIQTAGDFVIEAGKDERNLSLVWSHYKLSSRLDPVHEHQLWQVSREATHALKPVNEQLGELSEILSYGQKVQDSGLHFDEIKSQLKTNYPDIYSELWLEGSESFDAMILLLSKQKTYLGKARKAITDKVKTKLDTLVVRSTTEAMERDKPIEVVLSFFNAIGFDVIDQNKLNIVIATVNMNPQLYGLQLPMDFEQWSLGFDHDYGDRAMSTPEKRSFIQFFNSMLWEPLVDENIASGMTALSWQARMKLQVLNNQPVWFFMANLQKQDES